MGCSESKHAVATTESFSTRKKLTSDNSRKIQNSKVPHDSKPASIKDNGTHSNATLNDVPNQEVATYASQDERATKQVENKTSINDSPIKDNLTSNSKEQKEEDKNIKVANSEVLLPLSKEEGHDNKLAMECQDEHLYMNEESKNLSSQDGSSQMSATELGEKQIDLVEGDIDLNSNNTKDKKIGHGTNNISKQAEVQNALNGTEKTHDNEQKDVKTRHEEVAKSKTEVGQEDDENKTEVKQDNVATKLDTRKEVVETIIEEGKEDVGNIPKVEQENIENKAKTEQENDEIKLDSFQQEKVETTYEMVLENERNKIEADQKDAETKSKEEKEVVETIPEVEHEDAATPKPEQEDITTAMDERISTPEN